jgi:hypothetical protein
VPGGAQQLHERGAFELDVQQCELNLLRLLGAGAGKHPQVFRFGMPVDADWASVLDFYTAQLKPPWQRVHVPERQGTYRLAMWRRKRLA